MPSESIIFTLCTQIVGQLVNTDLEGQKNAGKGKTLNLFMILPDIPNGGLLLDYHKQRPLSLVPWDVSSISSTRLSSSGISEFSSTTTTSPCAVNDEQLSPATSLENEFIDDFVDKYSPASIGKDLAWLTNLGEQMYLDPMQALLDVAFEYPVALPIQPSEDLDDDLDSVFCDKSLADVPVDCGASQWNSSDILPLEKLKVAEENTLSERCNYADSEADVCSVKTLTSRRPYVRRPLPKVAREGVYGCFTKPSGARESKRLRSSVGQSILGGMFRQSRWQ